MSAQEQKRKGLNRRVVMFFVFAIACVAAFLIVGLVRTCNAEHEEKQEEKVLQEELGMTQPIEIINSLA